MSNKSKNGAYAMELKKIEDNKHLIGMVSVDEILRFGYEAGSSIGTGCISITASPIRGRRCSALKNCKFIAAKIE